MTLNRKQPYELRREPLFEVYELRNTNRRTYPNSFVGLRITKCDCWPRLVKTTPSVVDGEPNLDLTNSPDFRRSANRTLVVMLDCTLQLIYK